MFLAIKELKKEKKKFTLIISIVALISYLVFFLSGLANGLSQGNRSAVDLWQNTEVVMHTDSNLNLFASRLPKSDSLTNLTALRSVAYPGEIQDKDNAINVVLFGLDPEGLAFPDIIHGRQAETTKEVVVSEALQLEYNLELGNKLSLPAIDETVTIVGFTANSKYNVTPVIYVSLEQIAQPFVSAYLLYDEKPISQKDWEVISLSKFIEGIPGYTAQLYTFGLMIGFLIAIAALIIGVFMYILTLQKKEVFGIMKIQGVRNREIAKSVLTQTIFINTIGVLIGWSLVLFSALLLPAKVPFLVNHFFYAIVGGTLILFSSIGSYFSIKSISKIDPLAVLK